MIWDRKYGVFSENHRISCLLTMSRKVEAFLPFPRSKFHIFDLWAISEVIVSDTSHHQGTRSWKTGEKYENVLLIGHFQISASVWAEIPQL